MRLIDGVPIAPLVKLEKTLPVLVDEDIYEIMTTIAQYVSTAGKTAVVIVFLSSFLFNYGMNHILGRVQNLSSITHDMMMQLMYPETTFIFFAKVFEFVTFDMIPTQLIYPLVLNLVNVAYSDEADKIGYESRYLIWNSGSITLYIVLYAFM